MIKSKASPISEDRTQINAGPQTQIKSRAEAKTTEEDIDEREKRLFFGDFKINQEDVFVPPVGATKAVKDLLDARHYIDSLSKSNIFAPGGRQPPSDPKSTKLTQEMIDTIRRESLGD